MDEIRLQIYDLPEQQTLDRLTEDLDVTQPSRAAAFIDPFTGALIIAGVYAGAKLVMRLANEWRGGARIDLSRDPVDVRRDRGLPYGTFVIIAKSGDVRIETKDEPVDGLERMVAKILELILPTPEHVAQAVKEAVPNAVVTVV